MFNVYFRVKWFQSFAHFALYTSNRTSDWTSINLNFTAVWLHSRINLDIDRHLCCHRHSQKTLATVECTEWHTTVNTWFMLLFFTLFLFSNFISLGFLYIYIIHSHCQNARTRGFTSRTGTQGCRRRTVLVSINCELIVEISANILHFIVKVRS